MKDLNLQYIIYCYQRYSNIIEKYCVTFFEKLKPISPINLSLSFETIINKGDYIYTCANYGAGVVYINISKLCIILDDYNDQETCKELDMTEEEAIDFIAKHTCFDIVLHEICHSLQFMSITCTDPKYSEFIEEDNAKTMLYLMDNNPIVKSVINEFGITDFIVMESIEMYLVNKDFYHDDRNHTLELSIEYLLSSFFSLIINDTPNHNNDEILKEIKEFANYLNGHPFTLDIIIKLQNGTIAHNTFYIDCINDIHDKQAINNALNFLFQYIRPFTHSKKHELVCSSDDDGLYNLAFCCEVAYKPMAIMEQ